MFISFACAKSRRILCGLLLALVAPFPAWAGNFSATPVRLYMSVKDRAIAVTIQNEGNVPVAVQAEAYAWAQTPDGKDQLTPTDDLIISPPIAKLAPGARQVLRLARLGAPDMSRQLSYRLIVKEVPEATAPKQVAKEGMNLGIEFHLAMSMPVFITPPTAKRELDCQFSRASNTAELQASCSNIGNAYAQLRKITLSRGEAQLAEYEVSAIYILPGAKRPLTLKPVKAGQAVSSGSAQAKLLFDDGKTLDLTVQIP